MIARRRLVIAAGAVLASTAFAARAQVRAAVPRIGYLSTGWPGTNAAYLDALRTGLRELGYVDGRDYVIDARWAGNEPFRFRELAATVVGERPAAIVTTCIPSTRFTKEATDTIPIVMSVDGDPVAAGLVASLAHPGANVTGRSTLFEQLIPKWLEYLKLAAPKVRSVAFLRNSDSGSDEYYADLFEKAAKGAGIRIGGFDVRNPADIPGAFEAMRKWRAEALVVMTGAFFAGEVQRIVPLADRDRLPATYGFSEFADAGGLMSYGLSFRDYYRGVARYVDRVLKGARPADLPVEQPTRIELVVNSGTARKLGLALPPALLARADRVIA